ncbi:MAG: hypothetical protein U1E62_22595 [Alsobacter sp.]
MRLAEAVVAAGMAPRGMTTPAACVVVILHGLEVGLTPLMALQRIALLEGRPTIWGDGALALVRASGLCRSIVETVEGDRPENWIASCTVWRKGEGEPVSRSFGVPDARRASLWGRPGPWTSYPRRMLQMRARAFALRDVFPDVLGGLYLREEFEDAPASEAPASEDADRMQGEVRHQAAGQGAVSPASTIPSASMAMSSGPAAPRRRPAPPGRGGGGWVRLRPPRDVIRLRAPAPPRTEQGDEAPGGVSRTTNASLAPDALDPDLAPLNPLQLFDQELGCARDIATLQEIEAEFKARLAHLSRDDARRARHILERHRTRLADRAGEDTP